MRDNTWLFCAYFHSTWKCTVKAGRNCYLLNKLLSQNDRAKKFACMAPAVPVQGVVVIRVVATTPEKTHNQKFLTFETILNRFLVQFYPGLKKKKKKKKVATPMYWPVEVWYTTRPPTPDPPDPTLFGKPLCEKTERDRDMKISGFVDLDTADALKYVKIWSEDLWGPLRP